MKTIRSITEAMYWNAFNSEVATYCVYKESRRKGTKIIACYLTRDIEQAMQVYEEQGKVKISVLGYGNEQDMQ